MNSPAQKAQIKNQTINPENHFINSMKIIPPTKAKRAEARIMGQVILTSFTPA